MSGGSYNYLCWKSDLDELLVQQHALRDMADRLAGLGYAQDAAAETEELLLMLRQWKIRAETRAKRLEHVWKAVEWWDSCDWSEEAVHKALAAYRGEGCMHADTFRAAGRIRCNTCNTEIGDLPA
mgnify:CR=1 FL=1